ncbi:hypothetical protein [Streptomyces sp. NPDC102283]|uniref:hypothetical protein n=1 Tax=Streptomyces sp. NPDC102283 TaxID=3366155 RepID=UPI003828B044
MIWTSEDVARDQVRRQAACRAAGGPGRGHGGARERETREELRSPVVRGEFAPDPEELTDRWAALLTEWQRVAAHLAASGAGVYDADQDETGHARAREREDRHTRALRDHTAWTEQQRENGMSCGQSCGWTRLPGGRSVRQPRGPG